MAFAPLFIPTFMGAVLLAEQHEQPVAKIQQDWLPALLANWKVWVPAQLINFGLMPLHYQVLFANVVGVGWNVYMSMATHSALRPASAVDGATCGANDEG